MSIELPNLPYPCKALEPLISENTLNTHHGKHHRAYVDKTNALVKDTPLAASPLDSIVRHCAWRATADPATMPLFNNAAQAWNHAFYWHSLRPMGGHGPQGSLGEAISSVFGDERRFADAFKSAATGHFGSGWAWLVVENGALKIVTTSNADTPIAHGQVPLLVIDVWEHAYYLDHHERRAAYVAGVVDHLLNWAFAEDNYKRSSGDRIDDAVHVFDHCLSTAGIESALTAHPNVAEAAVVGYPHPLKGQGIYAYVTLKPGTRPSEKLRREIGQWIRREIGPIAVPDFIQWAPALPRTRLGMLVRRILRKIAANDVSDIGDTSMLVDSALINDLIRGRVEKAVIAE